MFHNLGVEIEKPVQKDNALSKLGFMQDTIYLPKRREHRANVEKNLPKQDFLEKADKKEEKIVKTQQKTEEKKEEKKPEKKAEKKAAIPEKTDNSPHSANFFQMYSKDMEETDQGKTWIMQHAPLNETLGVSYRTGSFKYRLSKKEREQKIKDPASLLYRKAENAALLVETVSDFETASFDAVNRAVTRQAFRIEKDEYLDLSAFMKIDITPHINGEREILFLRDDDMVYQGNTIASIRKALTSSQLVAEFIWLMNERDRIMCETPGRLCSIPKPMWDRMEKIRDMLHEEVRGNEFCPCQSGLKYKKCCGRE